jgi:hypothetical protein
MAQELLPISQGTPNTTTSAGTAGTSAKAGVFESTLRHAVGSANQHKQGDPSKDSAGQQNSKSRQDQGETGELLPTFLSLLMPVQPTVVPVQVEPTGPTVDAVKTESVSGSADRPSVKSGPTDSQSATGKASAGPVAHLVLPNGQTNDGQAAVPVIAVIDVSNLVQAAASTGQEKFSTPTVVSQIRVSPQQVAGSTAVSAAPLPTVVARPALSTGSVQQPVEVKLQQDPSPVVTTVNAGPIESSKQPVAPSVQQSAPSAGAFKLPDGFVPVEAEEQSDVPKPNHPPQMTPSPFARSESLKTVTSRPVVMRSKPERTFTATPAPQANSVDIEEVKPSPAPGTAPLKPVGHQDAEQHKASAGTTELASAQIAPRASQSQRQEVPTVGQGIPSSRGVPKPVLTTNQDPAQQNNPEGSRGEARDTKPGQIGITTQRPETQKAETDSDGKPVLHNEPFARALDQKIAPQGVMPSLNTTSPVHEPQKVVAPHALPPEVKRDIMDQVVKNFSAQLSDSNQEIKVSLKPESLGTVVLQVRVEDGKVNAQIDVTQPVVKSTIEANLTDLRQALHEKGLDVQRIDVFASSQSSNVGDGGHSQGSRTAKQRSGKRVVDSGEPEEEEGARSMGYNTLEIIM